jgi:hypothetical protein
VGNLEGYFLGGGRQGDSHGTNKSKVTVVHSISPLCVGESTFINMLVIKLNH